MQTLGIEDSGRRVTLTVGDTILVKLPGKESPGYGWVLTPGDPRVIDTADGETFIAKGAGTTRLVFVYHHPWERKTPIKSVMIDVDVHAHSRGWIALGIGAAVVVAGGIVYTATRRRRSR
jgi:hypothetical protein